MRPEMIWEHVKKNEVNENNCRGLLLCFTIPRLGNQSRFITS
jgi:hypothetical protein